MLSWPCVFAPSYIYWEAFPSFQQISCYPGTWALLWAIFIGSLQDLQQEWSKHYVWDLNVWVFNMLMLYSLFIVRGKCYSPGMFCGTTCSSCGLKVKHQPKFIPKVCGSFDLKLINCSSHFLEACYGPWRPNDLIDRGMVWPWRPNSVILGCLLPLVICFYLCYIICSLGINY